jgi:hypothetical protein
MDLHQRQQFDFLLLTAAERFVARLEERHRGAAAALAALTAAPEGEGVWRGEFVDAIFQDFLLDNADGAAFVLQSLRTRLLGPHRGACADAGSVEDLLVALAKALFAELLLAKAVEALEQHAGYQAV